MGNERTGAPWQGHQTPHRRPAGVLSGRDTHSGGTTDVVEIFLQIPAGDPVERVQQGSPEVADSDVHSRQPFSGLLRGCGATIVVLRRGQDMHAAKPSVRRD